MANIETFIQNSENLLQGLVNDKITIIKNKLRTVQCSQAHKILSLAYFVELLQVLQQNNIKNTKLVLSFSIIFMLRNRPSLFL